MVLHSKQDKAIHDYTMYTEEMLLKLLRKGDEQAFKKIYQSYWKELYVKVYKRIQKQEVAEEIVQIIFVDLWERREKLIIEKSIAAYLHGALKRKVLLYFRQQYNHAGHLEVIKGTAIDYDDSMERSIVHRDLLEKVERLICCLPGKSRQVFELSRKEFLSNKEIAEKLQVSEKTVEYHMNYALNYLRKNCREYTSAGILLILIQ